ncbi:hypothetical protein C8J57DRAFT_91658 [Mycena rebaudengoi]|nr:hypothetical protein C8J57DRAFT_91658 [Mycena rebaudengoi]
MSCVFSLFCIPFLMLLCRLFDTGSTSGRATCGPGDPSPRPTRPRHLVPWRLRLMPAPFSNSSSPPPPPNPSQPGATRSPCTACPCAARSAPPLCAAGSVGGSFSAAEPLHGSFAHVSRVTDEGKSATPQTHSLRCRRSSPTSRR